MLINITVPRTISGCIGSFNDAAAALGRDDFFNAPVSERSDVAQTLNMLIMRDEAFARPALHMLQKLAADENPHVRLQAAYAAGDAWYYESAADDALDLLYCLHDDESGSVREAVARMAGIIGYHWDSVSVRALDFIDTMKDDENATVRCSAALSLSLIGRKSQAFADRAKDMLMEMKPDSDPALNMELDVRMSEIRRAEERDFDPPEPPRGPGLM